MAVIVASLAPELGPAVDDELVAVYRAAFRPPPYAKGEEEVVEFARFLPEHAARPGFRLVVAREEGAGPLLGFAYGHENGPGQGWHEVVAPLAPPDLVAAWLVGGFRLAEMAVVPAVQGRGIGGRLHDRLLCGLPYRRAVLSTMAAETPALRLYRSRGWQVLLDDLVVPGLRRPYRIMGLDLAASVPGHGPWQEKKEKG